MWRRRPRLVLGEGFLGYCLLLTGGVTLPLVHESGRFLDVIWPLITFLLVAPRSELNSYRNEQLRDHAKKRKYHGGRVWI
jgi:hypothetical protein